MDDSCGSADPKHPGSVFCRYPKSHPRILDTIVSLCWSKCWLISLLGTIFFSKTQQISTWLEPKLANPPKSWYSFGLRESVCQLNVKSWGPIIHLSKRSWKGYTVHSSILAAKPFVIEIHCFFFLVIRYGVFNSQENTKNPTAPSVGPRKKVGVEKTYEKTAAWFIDLPYHPHLKKTHREIPMFSGGRWLAS